MKEEEKVAHGNWKRIGYDIYECSVCGQNVMTGDIECYKYCHGCGTRMDEQNDTRRCYMGKKKGCGK